MFPIAIATLLAAAPADRTLSGPYVHQNLTVFLIHGADRLKGRNIITLTEALKDGKVVVHETGEVSELSIENKSNQEVFVQAGDVVKGGKQDRVLSMDAILPPRSGKVPVSSFCVESGRWAKRAGEAAHEFSESNVQLASKQLKIAARRSKDQGEVWKEVANTQAKLSANTAVDVRDGRSATSLQLALENDKVKASIAAYTKRLEPIVKGKEDVIGFLFAINGKINSAEVFASPQLFLRQWSKLLAAAATEAVAEGTKAKAPKVAAPAAEGFLNKKRKKGETRFENADEASPDWVHTSLY